jgi:hypothetical protein
MFRRRAQPRRCARRHRETDFIHRAERTNRLPAKRKSARRARQQLPTRRCIGMTQVFLASAPRDGSGMNNSSVRNAGFFTKIKVSRPAAKGPPALKASVDPGREPSVDTVARFMVDQMLVVAGDPTVRKLVPVTVFQFRR